MRVPLLCCISQLPCGAHCLSCARTSPTLSNTPTPIPAPTPASQRQGAHLGVLAGALLQVLHVHLFCLSERLVVRLVDGLLQPEGIVAVNLLPVDGAIRAVDRLVPQLFMGREWSTVSAFVFMRHNGTCSAQDVLCAGDDRPQADTFVQQTSTDLATDVACARVPAGSWGIEHQKGSGRHVMASPKARRHTASQTCCEQRTHQFGSRRSL